MKAVEKRRYLGRAKTKAASGLLKAMANEHRLHILSRLAEDEYTVSELQKFTRLSQSALSQHLALLRKAQLVNSRQSGANVYYSLHGNAATRVLDATQ